MFKSLRWNKGTDAKTRKNFGLADRMQSSKTKSAQREIMSHSSQYAPLYNNQLETSEFSVEYGVPPMFGLELTNYNFTNKR